MKHGAGLIYQPRLRAHLPEGYQAVLDFGYLSGWRLREVTQLPWSEVDLPGGVITLDPGTVEIGSGPHALHQSAAPRGAVTAAQRAAARRLVGVPSPRWAAGRRLAQGLEAGDPRGGSARPPVSRSQAHDGPEPDRLRRARDARHAGARPQARSMFDRYLITAKEDERRASAALGERISPPLVAEPRRSCL